MHATPGSYHDQCHASKGMTGRLVPSPVAVRACKPVTAWARRVPAHSCPKPLHTLPGSTSQNKTLSHTDVNNLERAALALDELHGRRTQPAEAAPPLASKASPAELRPLATPAEAGATLSPIPPSATASGQEAAAQQTGKKKAKTKRRRSIDAPGDTPAAALAGIPGHEPGATAAALGSKPKSKKKTKHRTEKD